MQCNFSFASKVKTHLFISQVKFWNSNDLYRNVNIMIKNLICFCAENAVCSSLQHKKCLQCTLERKIKSFNIKYWRFLFEDNFTCWSVLDLHLATIMSSSSSSNSAYCRTWMSVALTSKPDQYRYQSGVTSAPFSSRNVSPLTAFE